MNGNQLINMAVRMIMRRLMRGGIDAGIGALSKPAKGSAPDRPAPGVSQTQKRMRSTMKIARRMGRM